MSVYLAGDVRRAVLELVDEELATRVFEDLFSLAREVVPEMLRFMLHVLLQNLETGLHNLF